MRLQPFVTYEGMLVFDDNKKISNKRIKLIQKYSKVSLGNLYNKPLPKSFSYINTIEVLIFGPEFNQTVDNLPNINYLKFGYSFNQPIDNLPITLKKLHIESVQFNQSIDNLPPNLEMLHIFGKFNQQINNLPNKLQILSLCGDFNQPINNLPPELKEISLGKQFNQPITNIPKTLVKLTIFNKNYSFDLNYNNQ